MLIPRRPAHLVLISYLTKSFKKFEEVKGDPLRTVEYVGVRHQIGSITDMLSEIEIPKRAIPWVIERIQGFITHCPLGKSDDYKQNLESLLRNLQSEV